MAADQHQPAKCVSKGLEIAAKASISHLIVDETPLLEERVHAHNRTDIAGQVTAAGSDCKIFHRVQPVGVDHKVAIILVYRRGLAPVPVVEELWQRLPLNAVDGVHVEPSAVAGKHNRVCLGN